MFRVVALLLSFCVTLSINAVAEAQQSSSLGTGSTDASVTDTANIDFQTLLSQDALEADSGLPALGRIANVAFQQNASQSASTADRTNPPLIRNATISLSDRSLPVGQGLRTNGMMAIGGSPHAPDRPATHTPLFSDHSVVKGDFPGSFKVPGTNTSLMIGGFVHADFFVDFNPIGTKDEFVTAAIPVPNSDAGNTRLIGRRSRLWFRSATPTKAIGDITTYVEFDFFNKEGLDLEAASPTPRLRQAWVETLGWRFGQDYSTFANLATWPLIFDIEGPGAYTGIRTGVLRKKFGDARDYFHIALEQPFSDLTFDPVFEQYSPSPDFLARVGLNRDWGNLQLAHVSRLLAARDTATQDVREYAYGWGLSLTGKINTIGKDFALFSVTGGEGVARYVEDSIGGKLDGIQNAVGEIDPLEGLAWWTGYTHFWNKCWYSTAVWGQVDYENSPLQAADAYSNTKYGAINLVWTPVSKFMLGVEYLYGQRTNFDGATGVANRMTIASQYTF